MGYCYEALRRARWLCERREWLIATGARYIWTTPQVLAARWRLYDNLRDTLDPHGFVVERIAQNIQRYVDAFNLRDSFSLLGRPASGA